MRSLLGDPTSLVVMSCISCRSINQVQLGSEIFIHSHGVKGVDRPGVMAFPTLVVCLDCGFSEFAIPQAELHLLRKQEAAA
jgi:hypothetical protein